MKTLLTKYFEFINYYIRDDENKTVLNEYFFIKCTGKYAFTRQYYLCNKRKKKYLRRNTFSLCVTWK